MKKRICLFITAALLTQSFAIAFAVDDTELTEEASAVVEASAGSEAQDAVEPAEEPEIDLETMANVDCCSFEYTASGQTEYERHFYVKYNPAYFRNGVKNFKINIKGDSSNIINITAESTNEAISIESRYISETRTFTCTGSGASLVVSPDASLLKVSVNLEKPIGDIPITLKLVYDSMIADENTSYSLQNGMNPTSVKLEKMSGIVNELHPNEGVSGQIAWHFEGDTNTLVLSGKGSMADYTAESPAPWYQDGAGKIIERVVLADSANITGISDYAFYGLTGLKEVDFKNGGTVGVIGNHAFDGCSSLKTVELGAASGIGDYAFANCSAFVSFIIPKTVLNIGKGAFAGCTRLSDITVPYLGGQKTSKDGTLGYFFDDNVPQTLLRVTVTDADRIADNAFKDCVDLEYIYINDVKEIGVSAFENCAGIKEFDIPTSVSKVPDRAFYGCKLLKRVELHDYITEIGEKAFDECSALETINDTNTIPSGVTTLNAYTFKNCSSLKELVIPTSVTTINQCVLEGCTSLHSLSIPFVGMVDHVADSRNPVKNQQFGWLFGCDNKDVPAEVTKVIVFHSQNSELAPYAFANCKNIEDINIKNGRVIHNQAFENCVNLKNLYLPYTLSDIGSTILAGASNLETLVVPFIGNSRRDGLNTKGEYIGSETAVLGGFFGWTDDPTQDDTKQIYDDAGNYHYYHLPQNLKNVAVLTQTTVPSGAFSECQNLEKASIVTGANLGDMAFYDCHYLSAVKLPENMQNIGYQAFAECYSLKNVNIPSGVKSIADQAFYNCWNLDIKIPESVTDINSGAFIGAGGGNPGFDDPFQGLEERLSLMADGFVIRGIAGSTAEQFAKANGYEFEAITEEEMNAKTTLTIAAELSDGSVQFDVTGADNGTAYVALYDAKGTMVGVKSTAKTSNDVQIEFSAEEAAGAVNAKVFLWNGMHPVTHVEEVTNW